MEPIFIIPDKASFDVPITIPAQWIGTALEIDIHVKPFEDKKSRMENWVKNLQAIFLKIAPFYIVRICNMV